MQARGAKGTTGNGRHLLRAVAWKPPVSVRGTVRLPTQARVGSNTNGLQKKRAVVVGGGWAGFGACYHLLKNGFAVTLLDASDEPGGLSEKWRSAKGRPVEAGIKGFWYHYENIYRLVDELNIQDAFTEWTQSAFWAPDGVQVEAPVLQDYPRLPAPLGTLLYTNPFFTKLPLLDRVSAVPLVPALLEYDADASTYATYDQISARELFRNTPGVSPRLYDEFLAPMLLVLMFERGEDLSAAAALDVFYTYILAHQADFDVRWCRGTIAEKLFKPWRARITTLGGEVLGRHFVREVTVSPSTGKVTGVVATTGSMKEPVVKDFEAEVVVLATGVATAKKIVANSPGLESRPEFRAVNNLSTTDVMAVRLWFDTKVVLANKSNVGAGFDASTGFTFYDLNQLQDEYREEAGSVIEVDFYNAGALLELTDVEIVNRVRDDYLAVCIPAFKDTMVVDFSILRFKGAVTSFAPGANQSMPETRTSIPGMYFAGDWVRQGPAAPYDQRGLSQEKALVTGHLAANHAAKDFGQFASQQPIGLEDDEPHIAAGKALAQVAKGQLPKLQLFLPPFFSYVKSK